MTAQEYELTGRASSRQRDCIFADPPTPPSPRPPPRPPSLLLHPQPENVRIFYGPEWVGKSIEILYQNGQWYVAGKTSPVETQQTNPSSKFTVGLLPCPFRYTANIVSMTAEGRHVVHFPTDRTQEVVNLHTVWTRIQLCILF
jgi:hypothetical protein